MQVWRDYKMAMGALRDGLLDPVPWLVIATISIPTVAVCLAWRFFFG